MTHPALIKTQKIMRDFKEEYDLESLILFFIFFQTFLFRNISQLAMIFQ